MSRNWLISLVALLVMALPGCANMGAVQEDATPMAWAVAVTATPAAQSPVVPQPVALTKDESANADHAASPTATQETAGAAATSAAQATASETVLITLGDTITVSGSGATVSGSTVNITAGGTYRISGELPNGQINVNTKDKVNLELAGMSVTSHAGPALLVADAKKVTLTLLAGATNYLTDSANDRTDDAALLTNDTLVIEGEGTLIVTGNNGEGIAGDDDIIIKGGTITVTAVDDGLDAHDNITVTGGRLSITGGGDGMKSGDDENAALGSVAIEGGTIEITAGRDGIQAATTITITAGDLTISTGGGNANSSSASGSAGNTWGVWGQRSVASDASVASAKGIKAAADVTITGGTISIDSSDDSLHSNGTLTISGGDLTLASGDDGIHADASITINGGDIRITTSYEGIESAVITINEGNVHVISSDDGINIAGGNDASALGGRPGQNTFRYSANNYLYVNGGYVAIDANGDGIDANGSIDMTGGQVIINGPTRNDNGALDYLGTFKITGGLLVAVGSSGMAQAPSTTSTRYSVLINLTSAQSAGTMLHIASQDGKGILTFVPTKAYQSIVFCSPELKEGSTYLVYTGGRATGNAVDGLYSGGAYTAGTQVASLTVTGIVTGVGSSRGAFPGGRRP